MPGLKGRFFELVLGLKSIWTAYTATNETTDIAAAKVIVPAKPPAGTVYRVKLAGSKSGANAAFTVTLKLGATQVITLTSDDGSAVDWCAEIMLMITSSNTQKVYGSLLLNTADPEVDYAAGTVDLTAGAELVPQITSGHASDTVTCEMCTVEFGP